MFWLGELIALVAGLIGVAIARNWIRRKFPRLANGHLDLLLITLLVSGLIISAVVHIREVNRSCRLESDVEAVRDYANVARLHPAGITGTAGAGLKETSPMSKALEGAWVDRDGKLHPSCNDSSLAKFHRVIELSPRFPWSYYALAVCLRARGDAAWRGHAETAVSIFERTTAVAGHHASHDQGLSELRAQLEDS